MEGSIYAYTPTPKQRKAMNEKCLYEQMMSIWYELEGTTSYHWIKKLTNRSKKETDRKQRERKAKERENRQRQAKTDEQEAKAKHEMSKKSKKQ